MQIAVARDGLAVWQDRTLPASRLERSSYQSCLTVNRTVCEIARGLGGDALVVPPHIGNAPETMPHSRSDPKRIRHVVLKSIPSMLVSPPRL